MRYLFTPIIIALFLISCVQTRTFTTNNQKLNEFNKPDYIGTIASIYFVDAKKNIAIEPIQTIRSIYTNDSIVRKHVKQTNFTNQQFDTVTSKKINLALIATLNYSKNNNKIKGFVTPDIFEEIGKTTASNFNLYFISTGFTKDTVLSKQEALLKKETVALNVLSGFAFGLTGVLVVNQLTGDKLNYKNNYNNYGKNISYKDAFEGKQGLRGFVIVYDKNKKEICYIREQFFASNHSPLELKSITKQVKNAFKETYF